MADEEIEIVSLGGDQHRIEVNPEEDGENPMIWMTSGVADDGYPFCHMTWGELKAQFSVEEMRAHALKALEVAEAAQSDAAVFAFLKKELKLKTEEAGRIIYDLRNYRSVGPNKGFQWPKK